MHIQKPWWWHFFPFFQIWFFRYENDSRSANERQRLWFFSIRKSHTYTEWDFSFFTSENHLLHWMDCDSWYDMECSPRTRSMISLFMQIVIIENWNSRTPPASMIYPCTQKRWARRFVWIKRRCITPVSIQPRRALYLVNYNQPQTSQFSSSDDLSAKVLAGRDT